MVGRMLGPYRVLELIGSGGMGDVHRAIDDRLQREVAIKVLPAAEPTGGAARARLRREAITLSQLNHPHVGAVYDVGTEGDLDYVVLEYLPGGTLAERLRAGPLSLAEVIRIGNELAQGLEAAHEHGIIHRDLKPTNVAFDSKGHAKIVDFGIAGYNTATGATPTGLAPTLGLGPVGTIPYMAPEQLLGGPTDERTDLHALGVVLHEMATGRHPFPGRNSAVAIDAILHAAPPPIRSINAQMPVGLEVLVNRLLEKSPTQRPRSASAVQEELEAMAAGVTKRVNRRPGIRFHRAGGALVGVAVLLVALAWARQSDLFRGAGAAARHSTSVIVFPLDVLGGEQGSAYLGRAFAEAVVVNLAQEEGLEVVPVPGEPHAGARGSTERIATARRVGAGHVVGGTLLRQDKAIRATINLIDVRTNRVDWGAEYDIDPSDVARSASALARELSSRLGLHPRSLYEYFRYESGTPEMAQWTGLPATIAALRSHDVPRGLALTESLLVRFPRTPQAHVMRLVALVDQDNNRQDAPGTREAVLAGLEALERIDPNNPTIAITRSGYWGIPDSETHQVESPEVVLTRVLRRSDLRPGLRSHALRYRARVRASAGRLSEASSDMEEAIRQDPANPYNYNFFARILEEQGRHEAALQVSRQAAAVDPAFGGIVLAEALEIAGHVEEAIELTVELCRTNPDALRWTYRARLLATHGRESDARRAIAEADRYPRSGASEFMLAQSWSELGDERHALGALRSAVELGYRSGDLQADSAFVRLWQNPSFLQLVERARPDSTNQPRS